MSTKAKAKSKFITLANGTKRRRPKFTKAGREAISKAQTARWRKFRAAKRAKLATQKARAKR